MILKRIKALWKSMRLEQHNQYRSIRIGSTEYLNWLQKTQDNTISSLRTWMRYAAAEANRKEKVLVKRKRQLRGLRKHKKDVEMEIEELKHILDAIHVNSADDANALYYLTRAKVLVAKLRQNRTD